MIFEPVYDGMVVHLDKSEFLEIVDEYIRENDFEFKRFCGVGI